MKKTEMNAIEQVLTNYAVENAQLKIVIAELNKKLEKYGKDKKKTS